MSELEQIAKQVSLLNRLIELLRMQEEPESMELGGWQEYYGYAEDGKICIYYKHRLTGAEKYSLTTRAELISHPLTQKAWSDELVRVATELDSLGLDPRVKMTLFLILEVLEIRGIQPANPLDAILNKYERNLCE